MKFAEISRDRTVTFGLTFTLISVLFLFYKTHHPFLIVPFISIAICIAFPALLKPFAFVFYNATEIVGKLLSIIVLSLVFFLIVTPIGVMKRLKGYDPMKRKAWKKDKSSVFIKYDHDYSAADLIKLF